MTTFPIVRSYTSLLAGLIVACGIAAHVGSAHADNMTNSVRVSFADLNLSTSEGVAKLYSRLRTAAGQVCGTEPPINDLLNAMDWSACRQGALTRAITKVGHPALIALHQQKTGVAIRTLVADSGERAK